MLGSLASGGGGGSGEKELVRRAHLSGQRLLGGRVGGLQIWIKVDIVETDTLLMVFCDDTGKG